MKRTMIAALVAALALFGVVPSRAANSANQYAATVSATTANSTVSFGSAAVAVEVLNDGPATIYYQPDAVAVASSTTAVPIGPCEGRVFSYNPAAVPTSAGIITASGTATVRVTAYFRAGALSTEVPPADYVKVVTGVCSTRDSTALTSATVVTTGDITAGDDLIATDDATVGDDLTVTDAIAAASIGLVSGGNITTANGASMTWNVGSESITLDTGGATTDSVANLLPANSIIDAVVCRVTTAITTATDWSLGDGTTAARFAAANSTMTAGATSVGLAAMFGNVSTTAAGPSQAAAAPLRITTTGTPGAGVIRCTVFSRVFVAPTS